VLTSTFLAARTLPLQHCPQRPMGLSRPLPDSLTNNLHSTNNHCFSSHRVWREKIKSPVGLAPTSRSSGERAGVCVCVCVCVPWGGGLRA
jgi:hypothetical protein